VLKSILVGLDGSEYSEGALGLALQWAKVSGAVIGGIAVVDIPGIFQAEAVPLGAEQAKEALDQSRLADARRACGSFPLRLRRPGGQCGGSLQADRIGG